MTPDMRHLPAQTRWQPEPVQAPAAEGFVEVPGARLWFWDTGGPGVPVVLLHAANGSAANWGYQQPVLAAGGYRVIGYSRRGHYRSDIQAPDAAASPVADLEALRQVLGLERFHVVGTAAGAVVAAAYAAGFAERVLSLVVANSLVGINDPQYHEETRLLIPDGFDTLPADFRELGASYRLGYPAGRERWLELERQARTVAVSRPTGGGAIDFAALGGMAMPVLLITGDADPFMPAERLRRLVGHFPHGAGAVIAEAGHSCFWEQPEAFNRVLLDHLAKVPGAA